MYDLTMRLICLACFDMLTMRLTMRFLYIGLYVMYDLSVCCALVFKYALDNYVLLFYYVLIML